MIYETLRADPEGHFLVGQNCEPCGTPDGKGERDKWAHRASCFHMVISKVRMTGRALGGLWVLISQTFQVKQAVQTLIVSGTRHLAATRCHAAHFQWFHREQLFLPAHILWTSAFFEFCSFQAATPWIMSSGWFLSGSLWCTPCHRFPHGGSVVTASCSVSRVTRRLPNAPACFRSAGKQQLPKGRRDWNLSRLECRRLHPSFLVIPEGLLDVHPTEDETFLSHRQSPWTGHRRLCGLFPHPGEERMSTSVFHQGFYTGHHGATLRGCSLE